MDKVLDIFIKDYEVMRSEIRLYINKSYLIWAGIFAIIIYGIFKQESGNSAFIIIIIPYLISCIFGYMSMVMFNINKTAGYIRFLEERINRMFGTTSLSVSNSMHGNHLPLLLWENYYADIGMDRDIGNQLKSYYIKAIFAMVCFGSLSLLFIIIRGYILLGIYWGAIHFVASLGSIFVAVYLMLKTDTDIRSTVREVNKKLLAEYNQIEKNSFLKEGRES